MSNRANGCRCHVSLSALLRAVAGLCIAVVLAAGLPSTGAAPVTFWVSAGGGVRAENGRAIFFTLETSDATSPQIQVFDRNGTNVESLSPLAAVPDAKVCAVWGVSVGPSGLVAVAAAFVKDASVEPAGALLIYGPAGELAHALRMNPTGPIAVEVDASDHIWVLSSGPGIGVPPVRAPVLLEYDENGTQIGSFFTFADFPPESKGINQGSNRGGDLSMGITSGRIWFWLPQSEAFADVGADGAGSEVVHTGLPPWPPGLLKSSLFARTVVHGVAYLPSGGLLARVAFISGRSWLIGLYEYDLGAKRWTALPPLPSVNPRNWFVGVDNGDSVWMSSVTSTANYKSIAMQLNWVPLPQALMGSQ